MKLITKFYCKNLIFTELGVSHEWLTSYLSERNQITVILFLLFINDLPNSLSIFKFILFADDSTLSSSFAEEIALEFTLTLKHQLKNVNNWLTANRICINKKKVKSSMAKSLPVENLLPQNVGSIINYLQ